MEDTIVLNKDSDTKYEKKYKCPYCELRLPRRSLADHIETSHNDMIPEGFTANRVAFNTINKKTKGFCTICKREAPWNEELCRYERLCGRPECIKASAELAEKRTHRHSDMRNTSAAIDMVHNKRMSNMYTFPDGGSVSYVGTYEKEFLKFMDEVMHFKSSDFSEVPIIEYKFQGKNRRWYPDFYLITYNLIIEIKDGGNNPNKAIPNEEREKQRAKEDSLKKHTNYNYIRLSNKNHAQFLEALMDIKTSLSDSGNTDIEKMKRVIKINENMNVMMNSIPVQNPNPIYIVNYTTNNVFSEPEEKYAICRKYMSDLITFRDGTMTKMNLEDFIKEAKNISVYEYLEGCDDLSKIVEEATDDIDFYELLTGKPLLDYAQIKYDNLFKEVIPFSETLKNISECIYYSAYNTMQKSPIKKIISNDIPVLENGTIKTDDDIIYYHGLDGVYAKNTITGMCTPFFKEVSDIPKRYIDIIK